MRRSLTPEHDPLCSLSRALVIVILIGLLNLPSAPAAAQAGIWCVQPGGGPTAPPCGNREAFSSFAAALQAARPNDQIRLASGIYTSTDHAVFDIDRPITISGSYADDNWQTPSDSQPTIIDGQGDRRGIFIRSVSVDLDHVIIQNGATPGGVENGGGIYVDPIREITGPLVLVNVTMRNNRADGSGGAIFFVGGTFEAVNTSFLNNQAEEDGAGFYMFRATLSGGTIQGNIAERNSGGGSAYNLTLTNVTVSDNTAISGYGGGVSIYRNGTISGSSFTNNRSNDDGGGLHQWASDGTVQITNSTFRNNRTEPQPGATSSGVASGGGAAVHGSLIIERSRFEQNYAQLSGGGIAQSQYDAPLIFRDVLLSHNIADQGAGGGMVLASSGQFERVEIVNNRAGTSGGGLMQTAQGGTQPVRISASRIVANEAVAGDGGGIAVTWSLDVTNTTITDNRAGNAGGGIYRNPPSQPFATTNRFDQVVIARNHAQGDAGGAAHLVGTTLIINSQILDNRAATTGGGLYIRSSEHAALMATVLGNNQADAGGSAIFDGGDIDSFGFGLTSLRLVNVTIASAEVQPGAAIVLRSKWPNIQLTNTLVTSHTVGVERPAAARLSGDYNAAFGLGAEQRIAAADATFPFTNTLRAGPRFVNPAIHNFHLRPDSPLVNQGDPDRSYAQQRDIDQQRVPFGPRADIGADELIVQPYRIWLPLVRLPGNY